MNPLQILPRAFRAAHPLCAILGALCLLGSTSGAATLQVLIETSDQSIIADGSGSFVGQHTARVGQGSVGEITVHVLPFELPVLPSGEMVQTATLSVNLEGYSNWGNKLANVDLYGVSIVHTSNSAAFAGYHVDGANPSGNTAAVLLHDDLATPADIGSTSGNNLTIPKVSNDFGPYLQSLYDGGAQAGEYTFLVLTHDGVLTQQRFYDFTTADSPDFPVPAITITTIPAATDAIWVDASAPAGGDGTAAAPYQEVHEAIDNAESGDDILVKAGSYDVIEIRKNNHDDLDGDGDGDLFNNYVTIKPAPGVSDPLAEITIKQLALRPRGAAVDHGLWDAYLRFEDMHFSDGVITSHGKNVEFVRCLVEREGDLVGSLDNINKAAFHITSSHVTVRDCEITNCAKGFQLEGDHHQILNNKIHYITHDGIFATDLRDTLIEGNVIFNADDGVNDDDEAGKIPENWNKHCDGMHFHTRGSAPNVVFCERVTIRGNTIYHVESQALILNVTGRENLAFSHHDMVVENNVFGPCGAAQTVNLVTGRRLVVRNNMLIELDTPTSFTSRFRTIVCDEVKLRLPEGAGNSGAAYNNYIPNPMPKIPSFWMDYNFFKENTYAMAEHEQIVPDPKLANPTAFDGILASDSPLINAGTRIFTGIPGNPQPVTYPEGIGGVVRDNRPDIGATEFPGLTPPAETPPDAFVPPATVYEEDYADANLFEDRWLNGQNRKGLAWTPPAGQSSWIVGVNGGRNVMTVRQSKVPAGISSMLTTDGDDWADYKATVEVKDSGTASAGFLLRSNLDGEGYYVDLKNGTISLVQLVSGQLQATVLADNQGTLLGGANIFDLTVETTGGVTTIAVHNDQGNPLLQASDAANTFTTGRLTAYCENGLHNGQIATHKRMDVFAVTVDTTI